MFSFSLSGCYGVVQVCLGLFGGRLEVFFRGLPGLGVRPASLFLGVAVLCVFAVILGRWGVFGAVMRDHS